MDAWPDDIERSYQDWLKSAKHYEHPSDLGLWVRFVELCAQSGENAPSTHAFEERLIGDHRDPESEYNAQRIQKHVCWYSGIRTYIDFKRNEKP